MVKWSRDSLALSHDGSKWSCNGYSSGTYLFITLQGKAAVFTVNWWFMKDFAGDDNCFLVVLISAKVFENFQGNCLKWYVLDLTHHFSSAQCTFYAFMQKCNPTL